jgi:hypothetical protein
MESPDGIILDNHHLFDRCGGAGLGSDWVGLHSSRALSLGGERKMDKTRRNGQCR